ncbi:MAG: hypothetical protein HY985_17780 [Magnetospirillum sp.]|nr:hypothetical protein [Magnetospirillum sp.]
MADPLKPLSDLQAAMFDAWLNTTRQAFDLWRHGLELQQNFLAKAAEQHHRFHIEIAEGPSLTDKYGKRCHDIDPERDV